MPIISKDVWITREGQQIEIKMMASSHLLATIHFIERQRFMNAAEVYSEMQFREDDRNEMVNYYLQFPVQYESLVAEAQRRQLIYRGAEGLVPAKKEKK
jgi:hypothetical protein